MLKLSFLKKTQNQTSFPNTAQGSTKKRKLALIFLIVITLIAIIILLPKGSRTQPAQSMKTDNYVSRVDRSNQQIIKNLTGYNWSYFSAELGTSEKQMLAVLLLLYNEETAVFYPEIQKIKLNSIDVKQLNLSALPTEPTKENLTKLIDSLINIENNYDKLGIIPAKTHVERLKLLRDYFDKNFVNSNYKIPDDAKRISEGVQVATNQKDYAKKMLVRYNNWLKQL